MSTTKNGKVVVITGASAGVGRATAREFAKSGARVGLLARGQEGLNGAREEIEAAGGRALVLPTDVADPSQVEAAADAVEREFGPIDVWVNNAMVSILAPLAEVSSEEFRRVTEVTYLGYVWGTMSALKRMRPRNRGCVVQVGSALAYRAIPLQAAYCGAKHAIRGFTESVRCELLHDRSRVRLTVVELPGLNTPQFEWIRNRMPHKSQPVGKIYQPEVAARAIVWAAHHDRRELYVGTPTVEAILGDKIAPGLLDHYMARTVYRGHQTDEPEDLQRPDNLWSPVPGDHGAHGPFDKRAKNRSLQLWATTHRRSIAAAVIAMVAGAALFRTSNADRSTRCRSGFSLEGWLRQRIGPEK
jgi:NAD(P)-dependent dehydrogenase (short-subunit alcohol dehydrogenase family)